MTEVTSDTRLVISGFGPFGDHHCNPSWTAAQAFAECAGTVAHLLPVTFQAAAQFGSAHLQAFTEDSLLFVHLGLAANRDEICFESRGQNERDATFDALEAQQSPVLPAHQPLITGGRSQRFCRLELSTLVERYNGATGGDLPRARVSEDCGAYVCNAILYHSLRACERARPRGIDADAVFVHLPPVEPVDARRIGETLAGLFIKTPVLS